MALGILTLHINLPGCSSLKEKRSRIKPLISRLKREFNISISEMDYHDIWQTTELGCAVISNDAVYNQQYLQSISEWIKTHWRDVEIWDEGIEIIQ